LASASWIFWNSVSSFLSVVVFALTAQKLPACAALAAAPPHPAVRFNAVSPAPTTFGVITDARLQLPMQRRARSGGRGAAVPLGGTPTNDQALVAKPAQRCWPAQLLPGESTKKTRGIVTWNSPHCHSFVARLARITVQVRSAFPHPETRVPGKVQLIDLVSGAYCAEFVFGIAVTVALSPAPTIWEAEAARLPQSG
jgi:hypothetical protein